MIATAVMVVNSVESEDSKTDSISGTEQDQDKGEAQVTFVEENKVHK